MNVDIKDFQYKILEIAFYFDEFCKKYDIEYYLMGGSALGAVRHHGFIPWDDDFDVFMTFNNYHKFLHYASIHLDTEKFHEKLIELKKVALKNDKDGIDKLIAEIVPTFNHMKN